METMMMMLSSLYAQIPISFRIQTTAATPFLSFLIILQKVFRVPGSGAWGSRQMVRARLVAGTPRLSVFLCSLSAGWPCIAHSRRIRPEEWMTQVQSAAKSGSNFRLCLGNIR